MMRETPREYTARVRSVSCPDCHAPVGAPCADRRTYDGDLFYNRTHRPRSAAVREARLRREQ